MTNFEVMQKVINVINQKRKTDKSPELTAFYDNCYKTLELETKAFRLNVQLDQTAELLSKTTGEIVTIPDIKEIYYFLDELFIEEQQQQQLDPISQAVEMVRLN